MTDQYEPGKKPVYPASPGTSYYAGGKQTPGPPPWADLTNNPAHGWPTEPERPKKVWTWVLIAVLVTMITACALLGAALWGGAEPKNTLPTTTSKAAPVSGGAAAQQAGPDEDAKIGETVQAGEAEYRVNAVKCGLKSVGSKYLARKAQGSFCRVDLTVTNMGRKPMLFHADSLVKAEDTKGRKFSADGEAGIYGNEQGAGFLDEINPGNQVRALVFFDLPKGAKLKEIEISGGLFGSTEVEIRV